MTDEPDDAALEITDMDVAVLALRRATAFSQVLRDHLTGRDAAHQKRAHVAVERRDDVVAFEHGGVSDRDRFHAVARIDATDDPSLPIQGRDPVLKRPGQTQVVIHLQ